MAISSKPLDPASTGESKLRGPGNDLGSGQKTKSADTDIRLDDEKDSLYDDGLEVEDDSEQLAGTRATDHRS